MNYKDKIQQSDLVKNNDYNQALVFLEEAHLLAQYQALPHTYVHWKEFFGQIPRIFLSIPGSITGRAPAGNLGSTKMGIFEKRK